jgi:plastocyanin
MSDLRSSFALRITLSTYGQTVKTSLNGGEHDGVFKSNVMDPDEKFSYKFTKAGTYPYYCSVHPKMSGRVAVQ